MFLYRPAWNDGQPPAVREIPRPLGELPIEPCMTIRAAGGVGGSEPTFNVSLDSATHNQVVLNVENDSGIAYDFIRFFRDGIQSGDYPGSTTSIVDNGVFANTQYRYRIEGGFTDHGIVSVSDEITVTTLPNPNTFELIGWPRTPSILDLDIIDTLYGALLYKIYRDGQHLATLTSGEYTDWVLPETTYEYYAEALTFSQLVLGTTAVISVTTPADPDPPPPARSA
jgi:hypothetical protein